MNSTFVIRNPTPDASDQQEIDPEIAFEFVFGEIGSGRKKKGTKDENQEYHPSNSRSITPRSYLEPSTLIQRSGSSTTTSKDENHNNVRLAVTLKTL